MTAEKPHLLGDVLWRHRPYGFEEKQTKAETGTETRIRDRAWAWAWDWDTWRGVLRCLTLLIVMAHCQCVWQKHLAFRIYVYIYILVFEKWWCATYEAFQFVVLYWFKVHFSRGRFVGECHAHTTTPHTSTIQNKPHKTHFPKGAGERTWAHTQFLWWQSYLLAEVYLVCPTWELHVSSSPKCLPTFAQEEWE